MGITYNNVAPKHSTIFINSKDSTFIVYIDHHNYHLLDCSSEHSITLTDEKYLHITSTIGDELVCMFRTPIFKPPFVIEYEIMGLRNSGTQLVIADYGYDKYSDRFEELVVPRYADYSNIYYVRSNNLIKFVPYSSDTWYHIVNYIYPNNSVLYTISYSGQLYEVYTYSYAVGTPTYVYYIGVGDGTTSSNIADHYVKYIKVYRIRIVSHI